MRINDRELRYAIKTADSKAIIREGFLMFSDLKEGEKPRAVKLIGSLLALFRVSATGVIPDVEPAEVILLTDCSYKADSAFNSTNFHIISRGAPYSSSYTFQCKTPQERDDWVSALQQAAYSHLQQQLLSLKSAVQEAHSRQVNKQPVNQNAGQVTRQAPTIPARATPGVKPQRPAPAPPVNHLPVQANTMVPVISADTRADLESIFAAPSPHDANITVAPSPRDDDLFGRNAKLPPMGQPLLSMSDPFSLTPTITEIKPSISMSSHYDASNSVASVGDSWFDQPSSLFHGSGANTSAEYKPQSDQTDEHATDLLIDFS